MGCDANDVTISDANDASMVVPYRYRKIRRVGTGWVVCAGSYLPGARLLEVLEAEAPATGTEAQSKLARRLTAELQQITLNTGSSTAALYDSRLLGVSHSLGISSSWVLQLDPQNGVTLTATGDHVVNWPHSVTAAEQDQALARLASDLKSMSHLADAVKAGAGVVAVARNAPDCSSYVQIGITVHNPTAPQVQSFYVQGSIDHLMIMSNEEIMALMEPCQ